jgi:inner membrane protein
MDSLTQIVLGAAVGEAVAGKKLGNRAILWGAIAGTIPDLDVIPGLFLTPLDNLLFHRGATHSLLFCILGSFIFAYLARLFYNFPFYLNYKYRVIQTIIALSIPVIPAFLFLFANINLGINTRISLSIILFWISFLLWRKFFKDYLHDITVATNMSYSRWVILFFLGFLTHTLLDCFTTYGTQLLWPFFTTRISWDIINVVDPLYTVWFLVGLFFVMRLPRESISRNVWNWFAIGMSSLYLLICTYHKTVINDKVALLIKQNQIEAEHVMTTPTVFNNLLWYVIVVSKDTCYTAHISMLDEKEGKACFKGIPKHIGIDSEVIDSKEWQIFNWFSGPYYTSEKKENAWIYRDLRFGTMDFYCDRSPQYVFEFQVEKSGDKDTRVIQTRYDPGDDFSNLWSDFKNRTLGKMYRPL